MTEEQARKALGNMMDKRNKKLTTFIAKVSAVDAAKGLCDVQPVDGSPEYFDVRLVPSVDNVVDGVVPIPKVGSYVVCGRLENENDVYVVLTGEVTKYIIKCSDGGVIELNGNKFSMVKAETLQQELDKSNAILNAIYTAFKNGTPPTGADAGVYANALFTALKTALTPLPTAQYTAIKNEKVKHG